MRETCAHRPQNTIGNPATFESFSDQASVPAQPSPEAPRGHQIRGMNFAERAPASFRMRPAFFIIAVASAHHGRASLDPATSAGSASLML